MHDLSYQYGFDEKAGNFQQNNLGRGGEGMISFLQMPRMEVGLIMLISVHRRMGKIPGCRCTYLLAILQKR